MFTKANYAKCLLVIAFVVFSSIPAAAERLEWQGTINISSEGEVLFHEYDPNSLVGRNPDTIENRVQITNVSPDYPNDSTSYLNGEIWLSSFKIFDVIAANNDLGYGAYNVDFRPTAEPSGGTIAENYGSFLVLGEYISQGTTILGWPHLHSFYTVDKAIFIITNGGLDQLVFQGTWKMGMISPTGPENQFNENFYSEMYSDTWERLDGYFTITLEGESILASLNSGTPWQGTASGVIDSEFPSGETPEPASILLIGSGMLGLIYRRKRAQKKE